MGKPYIFRNPQLYPEYPWRRWLRDEFPAMPFPREPSEIAVEDIDLAITNYGASIGRDPAEDGRVKLIEVKQLNAKMTYAQKRMYALLDRLLREGDPEGRYYGGFHVLRWEPLHNCKVNGLRVNMAELAQFFLVQREIEPIRAADLLSPDFRL